MRRSPTVVPSRSEEIAFQVVEQALNVEISLADAGQGPGRPDGSWSKQSDLSQTALLEVTSPPAHPQLKKWAEAHRRGEVKTESGAIPARLGELNLVCMEILASDWARENFRKLLAWRATERHLYLFGRQYRDSTYFERISDTFADAPREDAGNLTLPNGISDVWFQGRARRSVPGSFEAFEVDVARFNHRSRWHWYTVRIEEAKLPPPNLSLTKDPFTAPRRPKQRTLGTLVPAPSATPRR